MAANIGDLSNELLVEIFSHYVESEGHVELSRNVAPVCRTWWNASTAPSLWKSVHLISWDQALSLSNRGLLCHTEDLRLPDRRTTNHRARKYHDRVVLEPGNLSTVLQSIRELKALEISNNTIDGNAMRVVARYCPHLEHLCMSKVGRGKFGGTTLEELDPVLTACGPKLKYLNLTCCELKDSERFISVIVDKCPLLEVLKCCNVFFVLQRFHSMFPIQKVMSGCPRLRKLVLSDCEIVIKNIDDCSGFSNLTVFEARRCSFHKMDVCNLLKNSANLDHLEFDLVDGLVFKDVSKIPSNGLRFLDIQLKDKDMDLKDFKLAVNKWKHTLLRLRMLRCGCNITSVLETYLDGNPCPKLEALWIEKGTVDLNFLKIFILKCQNLKLLTFKDFPQLKMYENREEIMKFLDTL